MFHVKHPKQPTSIPPQHLTFRGTAHINKQRIDQQRVTQEK